MRHFVAACVVLGLAMAACGGGNKQPMVPDQPSDDPTLAGDAGADMPSPAAPKAPK